MGIGRRRAASGRNERWQEDAGEGRMAQRGSHRKPDIIMRKVWVYEGNGMYLSETSRHSEGMPVVDMSVCIPLNNLIVIANKRVPYLYLFRKKDHRNL